MTTIEKVTCFPNEGLPQIIAGAPQAGDLVRITTPSGAVIFERYTPLEAPPAPVRHWDEFDFRKRFTSSERKAITAAAKVNADVEDFVSMLECAGRTGTRIKADDPLLIAALDFMSAGDTPLLGEGRKDEILGA